MRFLKSYVIALVVFFLVDMIWLVVVARNLYRQQLGYIMKTSPNWYAAIAFYLLFIVGLVYFVIDPSLSEGSLIKVVSSGAFFGFITYATYDLTNLATLESWPLKITMVDMAWGTVLGATVSTITYLIVSRL